MSGMRSQTKRDQQTITIATSLGIFVGIVLAGMLLGVLVKTLSDLPGPAFSALTFATVLLAGVVSVAYLVRHRRS